MKLSTLSYTLLAASLGSANKCLQDGCLREVRDPRFSSEASLFCAMYTTALLTNPTAIPTYLENCLGSPSAVSSACSCFMSSTSSTTAVITSPPAPLQCRQDGCPREQEDPRFSSRASAFCKTYTTAVQTNPSAIPTYLENCLGSPSAVSSACSCLMRPTRMPTTTTSLLPTATVMPNCTVRNYLKSAGLSSYNSLYFGPVRYGPDFEAPPAEQWRYSTVGKIEYEIGPPPTSNLPWAGTGLIVKAPVGPGLASVTARQQICVPPAPGFRFEIQYGYGNASNALTAPRITGTLDGVTFLDFNICSSANERNTSPGDFNGAECQPTPLVPPTTFDGDNMINTVAVGAATRKNPILELTITYQTGSVKDHVAPFAYIEYAAIERIPPYDTPDPYDP